jgi:hypothetical protein
VNKDEFILRLILLGWTADKDNSIYTSVSQIFIKNNEETLYISTEDYNNVYDRVVRYYPYRLKDSNAMSFITFDDCIIYLTEKKLCPEQNLI